MTDLRKAATEVTPQVTPEVTGDVDETAKGEHEPWCDSVTKLLLSMPPQIPPCNCKPKREWVGLTDEEIYDYADKFLYQHGSNYGIRSFGKAIEAKLKEKNT